MDNNDMIANPEKFKAIVPSKRKQNLDKVVFVLRDQTISTTENDDLLGVTIDSMTEKCCHVTKSRNRPL